MTLSRPADGRIFSHSQIPVKYSDMSAPEKTLFKAEWEWLQGVEDSGEPPACISTQQQRDPTSASSRGNHKSHNEQPVPPDRSRYILTPPQTDSFSSRPRKRKRSMNDKYDDDDAGTVRSARSAQSITTSTSCATSFQNRPILQATPVSSRARSTSPTRKVLTFLKQATPAVDLLQPDKEVSLLPMAQELWNRLISSIARPHIPSRLRVSVKYTTILQ